VNRFLSSVLNRLAFVSPGGSVVRPQLQRWRGASIGRNVWIGQYVYVDDLSPEALTIGDNCTISLRTTILTHVYGVVDRSSLSDGRVVIEEEVFIGPHCLILPNVRIGRGAVIKAGTIVTTNVPAGSLWGSPAAEMLGSVTVPLTSESSYQAFLAGIRPLRRGNPSTERSTS
jgi:acetyltransferase-like isoleucine patch superfamily enzyme